MTLTDHQRRLFTATLCQHHAHDLPCEDCGPAVDALGGLLASLLDAAEEFGFVRGYRAAMSGNASLTAERGVL